MSWDNLLRLWNEIEDILLKEGFQGDKSNIWTFKETSPDASHNHLALMTTDELLEIGLIQAVCRGRPQCCIWIQISQHVSLQCRGSITCLPAIDDVNSNSVMKSECREKVTGLKLLTAINSQQDNVVSEIQISWHSSLQCTGSITCLPAIDDMYSNPVMKSRHWEKVTSLKLLTAMDSQQDIVSALALAMVR